MAIIFDLDGTLIDSTLLHMTALKNAIKSVVGSRAVSQKFISRVVRYPLKVTFSMMRSEYGSSLISLKNEMEIKEKKAEFFNDKNLKKIKFFKGATALPKLLTDIGIKFCIVTSMSPEELNKFDKVLHLEKISNIIITPPNIHYEKPNPYTLKRAIKLLKANRKKTFYVGDSPYDGIASKRAGIGFIGVHNREELGRGEFYNSIPKLIDEIKRNPSRFKD